MPGTCLQNRIADLDGQGDGIADDRALQLSAGHGRSGGAGRAAHLNGDGPGVALQRGRVVEFVEDRDVATRIGDHSWGRIDAIDHEGVHLQLGEGSSHAIAIDDW